MSQPHSIPTEKQNCCKYLVIKHLAMYLVLPNRNSVDFFFFSFLVLGLGFSSACMGLLGNQSNSHTHTLSLYAHTLQWNPWAFVEKNEKRPICGLGWWTRLWVLPILHSIFEHEFWLVSSFEFLQTWLWQKNLSQICRINSYNNGLITHSPTHLHKSFSKILGSYQGIGIWEEEWAWCPK